MIEWFFFSLNHKFLLKKKKKVVSASKLKISSAYLVRRRPWQLGAFLHHPRAKDLIWGIQGTNNKMELVSVTGCWNDIYIYIFYFWIPLPNCFVSKQVWCFFLGGGWGALWVRRQPFIAWVIQVFQIQTLFFYNKWYLHNKNDTWLLWPQTNRRGRLWEIKNRSSVGCYIV